MFEREIPGALHLAGFAVRLGTLRGVDREPKPIAGVSPCSRMAAGSWYSVYQREEPVW